MAFHLLERDRRGGSNLSNALQQAVEHIGHCSKCRTFSEDDVCQYCIDPRRNDELLCIVETPADVLAIDQATNFKGRYFVLMGHLFRQGGIKELILATNPTVEGETTAHYLSGMAAEYAIEPTRLAHGIPLGGELEYIDGGTLAHAFSGRRKLEN